MSTDSCSLKIRFLTLVITTADLINERATPTLSVSHALIAPVAIFCTYVFLGCFVIGGIQKLHASLFLQVYGLTSCATLHSTQALLVFRDLSTTLGNKHGGLVLNGVLPMFIILLLLADIIVVLFSSREDISPSEMNPDSQQPSTISLHGS